MSDLLERLRATTDGATVNPDGLEAADEIERLRARNVALEKVLVCYRTGRQPTEKLHQELKATR
jgi:hypothetical protein